MFFIPQWKAHSSLHAYCIMSAGGGGGVKALVEEAAQFKNYLSFGSVTFCEG